MFFSRRPASQRSPLPPLLVSMSGASDLGRAGWLAESNDQAASVAEVR
jgi:hypothetical protein